MEPIDELARKRQKRERVEPDSSLDLYQELRTQCQADLAPSTLKSLTPVLLQQAWEQLGEALAWARSAEDAVETSDYMCLSCERDIGGGEHALSCIGYSLRAARRSLEQARSVLEMKYPEALG